MSSVYKVTEIEGKGLGCVATVDIEKGTLILTENPQICVATEEEEGRGISIMEIPLVCT